MSSKEYPLKKGFEYHKNGETVNATFIEYKEFRAKNLCSAMPVKQICMKAFTEMSDVSGIDPESIDRKEAKESKTKMVGTDLVQAILVSNQDVSVFFLHMRDLLTSGICTVDGEENFNKLLFDKLHQEDLEGLCGDYVLDFIMSSVLKD